MKKLLLLASILAISGITFSAEADLQVKAQIIKPLTITTEPADFGILVAGSSSPISTLDGNGKNGKILLSGGAKENILLKVEGLDAKGGLSGNDAVYLTNTIDPNSKLIASLHSDDNVTHHNLIALSEMFNHPFALNENGSLEFPVYGFLEQGVPADATPGLYTGTVKIKAEYDFNSGK